MRRIALLAAFTSTLVTNAVALESVTWQKIDPPLRTDIPIDFHGTLTDIRPPDSRPYFTIRRA